MRTLSEKSHVAPLEGMGSFGQRVHKVAEQFMRRAVELCRQAVESKKRWVFLAVIAIEQRRREYPQSRMHGLNFTCERSHLEVMKRLFGSSDLAVDV